MKDVVALIEQAGLAPVHLVGHDWGAAVAWALAGHRPDLLRSLTALSVPHPAAFLRAMLTSRQGLKSRYMYFFQLPWLPERVLTSDSRERSLRLTGMSPESAARDAELIRDRGAARGALNWYWAMMYSSPRAMRAKITVPTLYVWSDGYSAIGPKGATLTPRFGVGPTHTRYSKVSPMDTSGGAATSRRPSRRPFRGQLGSLGQGAMNPELPVMPR